jgi:hypothetical protein
LFIDNVRPRSGEIQPQDAVVHQEGGRPRFGTGPWEIELSRKDGRDGSAKRIPIIPVERMRGDDISDSPGGFSIFMFSPLGAPKADQKSRILQVKSMFGSAELDEDSIKYFAKNDFT